MGDGVGRRVVPGEVKGGLLLRSFPDLCLVISSLLPLGVQRGWLFNGVLC